MYRKKRICDSDYFPIYFRAAVPAEMFSEAELSSVVERLNTVTSEEAGDPAFKAVLDGIPPNPPKRSDFLWKPGRAVRVRLKSDVAEWLAYIAHSPATDSSYDLVNIGKAARGQT